MDLIDLLNDDVAELPFEGEVDLPDLLKRKFDAYHQLLATVDGIPLPDINLSIKLGENLIKSLNCWLNGQPDSAFSVFEMGLRAINDPHLGNWKSKLVEASAAGRFFRMRGGEWNSRFVPRDLFHIPFEKRDFVGTQRYSFPGLPCLYLSRSIYTCWEELGRPDLNQMWISEFAIAQDFTVLDLGYRPATIGAGVNAGDVRHPKALSYAILWPLIAACSVRRRPHSFRNFVVEYVIPQLLLRWVMENKGVDGIRYFSTHIEDHDFTLQAMNYAFPARVIAKQGHCTRLKSLFQLTHPMNWQLAAASNHGSPLTGSSVRLTISPGVQTEYACTEFGKVEALCQTLQRVPVI